MSEYNPFDKPLREIELGDLATLKTVHEGWYVEYKAEVTNASAIAKSISAFANTYGGWLFYGIGERSKEDSVAGSFPGIAADEVDATLQRIRQAVATNVHPSPHFETKVLWGRADDDILTQDRAIVAISVPQGHDAPYVHKNGVIYRRVADGSEPKPETDRHLLDQLWRRGEDVRREYRDWLTHDLDLSKSEAESPILRIFITPDLWRDQDVWADLNTSTAREIFSGRANAEETLTSMPFDMVQKTANGFAARQLTGNNPRNLTSTWFLNRNLVSEIVLPLPSLVDVNLGILASHLDGYDNVGKYSEALKRQRYEKVCLVDLNFVFISLIGVFHIQSLLNKIAGKTGSVYVKFELLNVWRCCPFLDVAHVVDYQVEHGVPLSMMRRTFAPSSTDLERFVEIPDFENVETPDMRKVMQAVFAFEPIASAMGIETALDGYIEPEGSPPVIYGDLLAAGGRARIAQDRRNARLKAAGGSATR